MKIPRMSHAGASELYQGAAASVASPALVAAGAAAKYTAISDTANHLSSLLLQEEEKRKQKQQQVDVAKARELEQTLRTELDAASQDPRWDLDTQADGTPTATAFAKDAAARVAKVKGRLAEILDPEIRKQFSADFALLEQAAQTDISRKRNSLMDRGLTRSYLEMYEIELQRGDYAAAADTVETLRKEGLVTDAQYLTMNKEALERKDRDYFSSAMLNPTEASLHEALVAARTGMYPDGSPVSLDPATQVQYANALRSDLESYDKARNEEEDERKTAEFQGLLQKVIAGQVPRETLLNMPAGYFSDSQFKALTTAGSKQVTSDPLVLDAATRLLTGLTVNPSGTYQEDRAKFIAQLAHPGISAADQQSLINRLEQSEQYTQSPDYKIALDHISTIVMGATEDVITKELNMLDPRFKEQGVVMANQRLNLLKKARELGPARQAELADYVREQEPIYKLLAAQAVVKQIGIPMPAFKPDATWDAKTSGLVFDAINRAIDASESGDPDAPSDVDIDFAIEQLQGFGVPIGPEESASAN